MRSFDVAVSASEFSSISSLKSRYFFNSCTTSSCFVRHNITTVLCQFVEYFRLHLLWISLEICVFQSAPCNPIRMILTLISIKILISTAYFFSSLLQRNWNICLQTFRKIGRRKDALKGKSGTFFDCTSYLCKHCGSRWDVSSGSTPFFIQVLVLAKTSLFASVDMSKLEDKDRRVYFKNSGMKGLIFWYFIAQIFFFFFLIL